MTTPDKEKMPTEDRTADKLIRWPDTANIGVTDANGDVVWLAQVSTLNPNTSVAELRNVADRIVIACNAYEPMKEALLAAKHFITNGIEFGFIRMPDRDDPAHNTLPMILSALSTLPVNDRHHSGSDNERLRKALSKIEVWADDRSHLNNVFETIAIEARAALNSTGRQTSDDVGILRELLQKLADAIDEETISRGAVEVSLEDRHRDRTAHRRLENAYISALCATSEAVRQARAALKGVLQPRRKPQ